MVAFPSMGRHTIKRFSRILLLLFLGLFISSYALGFIPAGAKEAFLAFVRPSDFDSFPADIFLQSVKIPASETWKAPRIIIPQISVDFPVILPTTQNLNILNAGLLKGVVRYPGSAMPGKTGNVLLFGHSTTFKVVHNKAYTVFSRLKELKPGDSIAIRSDTREYTYEVRSVKIKQADDARIDLTSDRKLLTLSSCNIIGGKESRYVVEAEFVKSYPLAK